ncbi:hypothetical protein L596_021989 [Steinernema carpocapsae]|uniref:CC domain-containing protein n=1 Tax=Steinernema carpocapsae TaxID=34508 RepID=A0A4U5MKF1_STECR|nr:hypothetical protein L596_021989 [Steinernema carpocapsae]
MNFCVVVFLALALVSASRLSPLSQEKSLAKRQTYWYYYICGTYPYQWTSYYPCNSNPQPQPQPNYCSNGGTPLGYTCYSNYQCNNVRWGAVCSNGQCCTSNSWQTSTQTPPSITPLCGGRETSNGYCNNGMCGGAFLCTSQNVCCRCSSGISYGPCVGGECPQGLTCNSIGQCCSVTVG